VPSLFVTVAVLSDFTKWPMATGDEELLSGLRNSDKGAYEVLFRRYYTSLFHQILYRNHDRDLAEDIAQESFVRLWVRRSKLKSHFPLLPFLITVAVNLLYDHQKHSDVAIRHEESVRASNITTGEEPDEILRLNQLQEQISNIISRHLSEKCRSIFVLSRIEGKSNDDIAKLLGISKKTIENQLYHALTVLRKKLSAYK
jgi:RNA polymerase sigma-70 factor, ECF subfamily